MRPWPGNLTISLALGVVPHAGFAWPEAGLSAIEGDDGTVIDTPRRGFEPVSRELCAEFEQCATETSRSTGGSRATPCCA